MECDPLRPKEDDREGSHDSEDGVTTNWRQRHAGGRVWPALAQDAIDRT
jgi:hypothetical protein